MNHPLCVLTPEIGVLSETFIDWDLNHLLPGRTVVISDPPPRGQTVLHGPSWSTSAPALAFEPVPGDPPPSADRVAAVGRFLCEHQVEVVVVEFLDFAQRWFDVLLAHGVRVWLRGHGADLSVRACDTYRRFSAADGVTVPTHAAARRLVRLGVDGSRVHIVPNHVEVPTEPPAQRIGGELVRCVSVGRLVPKKGHRYLIEAFAQAAAQDARLSLDIVGDGPLRDALAEQIADAGMTHRIRLLGQQSPDQVQRRMQSSQIFLHHAVTAADGDVEAQPLVILQAMAAALPAVLTRHEGIPEIADDQVNARLTDERDVEATTRCLLELADDPAQRHRLGLAAWATVRDGHSHQRARTQLLGLLGLSEESSN